MFSFPISKILRNLYQFEAEPDDWYLAHVFPDIQSPDNIRKLEVLHHAYLVGFHKHSKIVALPVVDSEQRRASFLENDITIGHECQRKLTSWQRAQRR